MKMGVFLSLVLSICFAFAAQAAEEGTSQIKLEPEAQSPLSNLNPRIVPQLGMSSLQYTGSVGGEAGQAFSGGVTTEVGATKARLLETGLLLIQSSSEAKIGPNGSSQRVSTSQIGIPLMAKIRFIDSPSQAWYLKFGATTTFQAATNYGQTTGFDVLAGAGVGVRVPMSKRMDLLAEATYNRGMIDAIQSHTGVSEGILFFAGLSIAL